MPELEWSLYACLITIGAVLVLLFFLWGLHVMVFYLMGCYHYRRHKARRAKKVEIRSQEQVSSGTVIMAKCKNEKSDTLGLKEISLILKQCSLI